ncbi:MAG: hypothetical protein ACRCYZ_05065, partial [Alphaproteobacteria bacterium]
MASKRQTLKARITNSVLERFADMDSKGYKTPFSYWMAILNDEVPELAECNIRDQHAIKTKAAESLAKYVYDHTYDVAEVEEQSR